MKTLIRIQFLKISTNLLKSQDTMITPKRPNHRDLIQKNDDDDDEVQKSNKNENFIFSKMVLSHRNMVKIMIKSMKQN
ncbi:CLUMA_CG006380, isoform A [Clunio marinus]|uniref:CLUMA_CG006380, isoform A n=1 Tax=Clunio marinus TaxID=568069 RepID=A0A1J1HXF0_9DIPT|nr:CLUMA_CG006380, isoform A [Clunio marinus]